MYFVGGWITFVILAAFGAVGSGDDQPPPVGQVQPAARPADELPAVLAEVGLDQRVGNTIPLDLIFKDESGGGVPLRSYFSGDRPIILTLNYSDCPMMCSQQLNGLVGTLRKLKETPGEEFDIITLSIDPRESSGRAEATKRKYVKEYGRPNVGRGWHFLTGQEEEIRKLANAVGYHYRFIAEKNEFAHPSAFMVLTPDGVVSQYVTGFEFDAETLRLILVDASKGKIGSLLDELILNCFTYDSVTGRYVIMAKTLMMVGGAIFASGLVLALGWVWYRESRSKSPQANGLETHA